MKFSIPFLPDPEYIGFISGHAGQIASVYYSLFSGPVLDSRARFRSLDTRDLARLLARLGPVRKYCLLNSRFTAPDRYHDRAFLDQLSEQMDTLLNHDSIDGIVFADFYLLTALSDHMPALASCLEAVPGVNCMLDDISSIRVHLDWISQTRFKPPFRIVLDRSLNRRPADLSKISGQVKSSFPGLSIELLANEGCISRCPFKPVHDAHISLCNAGFSRNLTHKINRDLGCIRYFAGHPERFLASPFIRPEDTGHYREWAGSLKISGRTLGKAFLIRCISAFLDGQYHGNLLDLMDAASWMAPRIHIDNQKLGPGFLKEISACTNRCRQCNICAGLFDRSGMVKPVTLDSYKEIR